MNKQDVLNTIDELSGEFPHFKSSSALLGRVPADAQDLVFCRDGSVIANAKDWAGVPKAIGFSPFDLVCYEYDGPHEKPAPIHPL